MEVFDGGQVVLVVADEEDLLGLPAGFLEQAAQAVALVGFFEVEVDVIAVDVADEVRIGFRDFGGHGFGLLHGLTAHADLDDLLHRLGFSEAQRLHRDDQAEFDGRARVEQVHVGLGQEAHGVLSLTHERHAQESLDRLLGQAKACEKLALVVDDDGAVIADEIVGMERGVLLELELDEAQSPTRADAELMAGCLPFGDGFDVRCGDGLTMRRKRPIKIGCS